MSKTQDKKLRTKIEHAEFLWNDAQMRAALLQQTLDVAIGEFETHKDELEADIVAKIKEQIDIRKKDIETFLMGEKDKYLERIGVQQD
jgi:hypothetical protein